MGRELQKRKNRSKVTKVRSRNSKRTKTGRRKVDFAGNETIAKNWDRNLTLSQNYKRLGLSSRLETASGGVEKEGKENEEFKTVDSLAIPAARKTGKFVPEEVQVERDSKTGRILRVIRPEQETEAIYNPLNDPLNAIGDTYVAASKSGPSNVVAELEREAAEQEEHLANRRPRQQSRGEEQWITRLVEKHGDDLRAMSRDKKLNPMQQTEGDIGRRIKKWKEQRLEG